MAHINEPIISLKDVRLTLESRAGPVEILRGIDLDIPAGQSIAVVGPSGSGKTSLLMVMAGLEPVTAGSIRVAGQPIQGLSEDDLAKLRGRDVGIVFQSFHLVPTMTAIENVALPMELRGDDEAGIRASHLLRDVGLGDRVDHYPSQLSGGEQQRVALARALAPAPRVLLADEPTGNLDEKTSGDVTELLFRLHKKTLATLVLITHDNDLARQCDRVVRMRDGKIETDELMAIGSKNDQGVAAE